MKKSTDQNLTSLRHSLAHLLAAAVIKLWPDTKRAIGPAIENGFYFDFEFKKPITDADLPKIEKTMREILPTWDKFERFELSAKDAKTEYPNNPYKHELIDEFSEQGKKPVGFYKSGNYSDLCLGGHIQSARDIKADAFKLTHIAGAYWRGDEKNPMLTRIYGAAFATKPELDNYLQMQKEAKKRDHRKFGRELDLFTFSELVGSGLPLYTPKGALVRRLLNDYIEELQAQAGYTQVWTPQIAKAELFKISGHYDKYKGDMFRVRSNYSDEEYFLKPMNCPQHTQIYASQMRSYRDLPLRYSDFAMLYRDEKPGELIGLARVRSFSQDDSHIFCREDQVDQEIDTALDMIKKVMTVFGFKYRYRLSTRDPENPKQYLGDPKTWNKVESWAEKIMKRNKIDYFEGPGEAAFYAPKMDLMATDALGREWQLSTVQIDYVHPERFNLEYIDDHGQNKRPVIIHRAIIGSSERFIMILLEHLAGALPLWLSPVQIAILPISDQFLPFAKKIEQQLLEKFIDFRIKIDERSESIGKKIRDAEKQKTPYMLILGKKEQVADTVSVRQRGEKDLGEIKVEKLAQKLIKEIQDKSLASF